MALSAANQALALFKKWLGKTSTNTTWDYFEEGQGGPNGDGNARQAVLPSQIWIDAASIPNTAPGSTGGVVQKLVDEPTTAIIGASNAFYSANLVDTIPFNFGDGTSYDYTIKDSIGNVIPKGMGDWILDPDSGIITFYGTLPPNMPPKVSCYKYTGTKGLGGTGGGITLSSLLTGFSSTTGTVSASDTLLQAIEKLAGNAIATGGGSGGSGSANVVQSEMSGAHCRVTTTSPGNVTGVTTGLVLSCTITTNGGPMWVGFNSGEFLAYAGASPRVWVTQDKYYVGGVNVGPYTWEAGTLLAQYPSGQIVSGITASAFGVMVIGQPAGTYKFTLQLSTTNSGVYAEASSVQMFVMEMLGGIAGATGPTGPTGPAGPTGATGPAGPTGSAGAAGTPGSVWRNGSGAPSNSLGVDGDYYLDTATGNVYKRASGAYSIVGNIVGPTGPAGPGGSSGFTAGDIKFTLKTIADSGWVMADDGTIGDASSGASNRANADCVDLFTILWNNVSNTYAPVVGGRGASAAADWAAHKKITLTKMLGRALGVAGAGSGLTSRSLGETQGEETHTLTSSEMPSHKHRVNVAPGVGGSTPVIYSAGVPMGIDNGGQTPVDASNAVETTGGGVAHNNMQPTTFLNVMIKL